MDKLELKDVKTLDELIKFINNKVGFSQEGCKGIVAKTIQLSMTVNSQNVINLMYLAYKQGKEGTEEILRREFSEWLVKIKIGGI